MDTTRVDICYRPLRIAWAIQSDDWNAFRRAVRLSHTLWGGRHNPIVFVDYPQEAKRLIERFRVDIIWPIGDAALVEDFPNQFPYLINPFQGTLFLPREDRHRLAVAQVLDIHNMLVHHHDTPQWRSSVDQRGLRRVVWEPGDPLGDTFLIQYGAYPSATEIGIDYASILSTATTPIDFEINAKGLVPAEIYEHATLGFLARYGMRRHYSIRSEWDYAGFFVGDAANIHDLVRFWNIRAADVRLALFIDPAHLNRYASVMPELTRRLRADLSHLDEHDRTFAVWSRPERMEDSLKLFRDESVMGCPVRDGDTWVLALRPPMMIIGEASSLGVFGVENGKARVSFSLSDKPFSSDLGLHSQHLVASVSLFHRDEQQTFHPPYVPEFNLFYARKMYPHFFDEFRIEPDRLGIVVRTSEHDSSLYALSVAALVEQIFEMAGLSAKLSAGGLITRQLMARLGGIEGARVFKIPGVRRLLKQYGPLQTFTKVAALSLIGGRDVNNPQACFEDHAKLFIEPRAEESLTPGMVFTYLVAKGLLRMGMELTCPTCALRSWIALDVLQQSNVCELCGSSFDGTRQLVAETFHYRRTGVLGLEKNSLGAVPVALVLQQLHSNLLRYKGMYAPSYELDPKPGILLPKCEIDLFWIDPEGYPGPSNVIIGECKDEGSRIDAKDVENMQLIADALPAHRFKTFVLFAKLSPFSPDEIALAKTLNRRNQNRVILLTARELEPYRIFERTQKETGIKLRGAVVDELAMATSQIYFPH